MNRIYKTEAIIIKRKNYSEADKIVTILSKRHGKLTVLAKGIRKITSKRAPHLELFHHTMVTLAIGRTWDIVTEAETHKTFPGLQSNLDRLAYTYKIAEIIDHLCPEKQPHPEIFTSLIETFRVIEVTQSGELSQIIDTFTLKLLWDLGFLPRQKVLSQHSIPLFMQELTERPIRSDAFLTKIITP